MTTTSEQATEVRVSFAIQAITVGFGAVVLMWAGWFIANLPGLGLPTEVAATIGGVLLIAGVALFAREAGKGAGWKLGLASGIVAGLVNLLALGSLLMEPGTSAPDPTTTLETSVKPAAPMIVGGFMLACAVAGILGGVIASQIRTTSVRCTHAWLSRFGWIAAVATLELILVGGLVTSAESGLAVPDWPNSYGANMFLYPIALMSDARIFLEHSHRLFGTMVGLLTITLAICVIILDKRNKVRVMAGVLAGLVIFQGVLGGLRVTEQSAWLGVFHGVLAQIFLALLVAQAVWLAPAWQRLTRSSERDYRKWKFVATAATHTTIIQLAFGAMYRHVGSSHALMTHIGFSVVVLVFAIMASAGAMSLAQPAPALARRGSLLGKTLMGVVGLQLLLGVGALMAVMAEKREGVPTADELAANKLADGSAIAQVPLHELLLATGHQANGAILLALLTMSLVWAKRAYQKPLPQSESPETGN